MELRVKIEEEGSGRVQKETIETEPGTEIADVLGELDINPQTVLVERDDQIITHKDEITEADEEITVLDVISGG